MLPDSHIDGNRGGKKSAFKKVISAILAATAAAFGVITCLKGSERSSTSAAQSHQCPMLPEEIIRIADDNFSLGNTSIKPGCGFNSESPDEVIVEMCTKKANGTVLKVTSIPNFTKHYVNGRQGVTKIQSVGPCCDKTTLQIPTSGEVFNKACKGPGTSTESVLSYINNEENCKSCDDPSKC